jgi:hypothetical protein
VILKLIRAQDKTAVTEAQRSQPLAPADAEAPKKSAVDDKDRHYVRELYCQTVGDEVVLKSRANKKLWVHQEQTFAALRDLYVQAVVEACDHSEKALWERVKEVCTSMRAHIEGSAIAHIECSAIAHIECSAIAHIECSAMRAHI